MPVSIVLEDEIQVSMDRLVQSGQFKTPADVIAKGIALIEAEQQRLQAFDAAIAQGWSDSQNNDVVDLDAGFVDIEAKWRAKAAVQAA
jgi:Arc/MetJ-type ribon-helix-helix transcriptional regulator